MVLYTSCMAGQEPTTASPGWSSSGSVRAITAGSRVSVLGIEGRTAYEITAVGIGSGSSADAALAQLQGTRPPAPAAPPPPVPAPTPASEAPTPATPPAAVPKSPSVLSAPPAPAAPAALKPRLLAAPAPVAIDAMAAAGPTVSPAAMAPRAVTTTAPMLPPADDHRWVELVGEVETFAGRTLVLKVDGGRVSVDVSSVGANLERVVTPGAMVKVYGVPVELRFKAMGFIGTDARGPGR